MGKEQDRKRLFILKKADAHASSHGILHGTAPLAEIEGVIHPRRGLVNSDIHLRNLEI